MLVARVRKLAPKSTRSKRFQQINDFEKLLFENGTSILKFYLHISPEEQLKRFKQRLDDPSRRWKVSESDYADRELWPDYIEAYEEAISETSTKHGPWFVIPSDHKWFRNLAISEILDGTGLELPKPRVNIDHILRKYHAAENGKDSLAKKRKLAPKS